MIILFDLILPELHGFDVLKQIHTIHTSEQLT